VQIWTNSELSYSLPTKRLDLSTNVKQRKRIISLVCRIMFPAVASSAAVPPAAVVAAGASAAALAAVAALLDGASGVGAK
jgi:hypothetical protein